MYVNAAALVTHNFLSSPPPPMPRFTVLPPDVLLSIYLCAATVRFCFYVVLISCVLLWCAFDVLSVTVTAAITVDAADSTESCWCGGGSFFYSGMNWLS